MINVPDRRKTVELIDEARRKGARQKPCCRIVGISSRTYQRWTRCGDVNADQRPVSERSPPANKLSDAEKDCILKICHKSEYASLPPGQIVPRLADKGEYIASESSFYRVLHQADEQHHRGRSQKPSKRVAPKGYCATGANQVWTWDITWLAAGIRGMFFYLYVIVDVFSRKIVGWEIYERECSELAAGFVHKAVLSEGCLLKPPVLHSDNGSPQKGSTLKAKLEALGIMPSFSRPRVSNDNPYSEALFRTCKYRPDYPSKGFETLELARSWVKWFVNWYNNEHRHSGIGYVTPCQRHTGQDREILIKRKDLYHSVRQRHPERWSSDIRNWDYIEHVWLNPPKCKIDSTSVSKKAA